MAVDHGNVAFYPAFVGPEIIEDSKKLMEFPTSKHDKNPPPQGFVPK